MTIFLNTTGQSVLGIGICARCSRKFPLLELQPDRNSPGLMVCKEDNDQFDPYRLPPRQPDQITLPFNRPDTGLDVPARNCVEYILATETPQGLQADGQFGWDPQPGLRVDSLLAEQLCDRQNGIYNGRILTIPLGVEITDPGVEVTLTWPLDVGFEVDHYEVYAYYDVANPTAADLTLITTLGPAVDGYVDTHGYTTNFGYTVVAVGVNGERAYTPGVAYTAPASSTPPLGPDVIMVGRDNFAINVYLVYPGPNFNMAAPSSFAIAWDAIQFSQVNMLAWSNDRLYFINGSAAAPNVYMASQTGAGNTQVAPLNSGGGVAQPITVRAEQGGTTQRVWVAVQNTNLMTSELEVGVFSMIGTTYNVSDLYVTPNPVGYEQSLALDANSFDGGNTVLVLAFHNDPDGILDTLTTIYSLDVGTGIWTTVSTLNYPPGTSLNGTLVKMPGANLYCAATGLDVRTSTDGITWTTQPAPPWSVDAGGWQVRLAAGVVNGISYFVAVIPDRGVYYYSTDGVSWTTVPALDPNYIYADCAIQGGFLALVGYDSSIGSSIQVQADAIGTPVVKYAGWLSGDLACVTNQIVA